MRADTGGPVPGVRAEELAVYASFAANGVLMASWASRIPQVSSQLDLSPRSLGLLIVCMALGAVVSLPITGQVVGKVGPARAVEFGGSGTAAGLAIVAVGVLWSVWAVAGALFVLGFAMSFWNVAQNVEAASVEHATGRALMPRFHAAFSLGTVAGALAGAGANALGIAVTAHLLVVAVLVAFTCVLAGRRFAPRAERPEHTDRGAVRRAWREPRTLAIGLFAVAMAFAEGTGMDWIAVTATQSLAAAAAIASLAYAALVVGVTATRWMGPRILGQLGRVRALRWSIVVATAGVVVVVFSGSIAGFVVGAFAWGCGIALGYPVMMSAAADDPAMAAPRVSVVATLTVTAYLGGPTLIGFVADRTGTAHALLLVAAALAIAFALAPATKPLAGAPAPTSGRDPSAEESTAGD